MAAEGAPITLTVTFTAETDKNSLLGRPGQYTSKAAFADTRAKGPLAKNGEIEAGGGVECFGNTTDTQKRATYLATVTQSSSMFNEYNYTAGDCLLRLSRYLTPDQAATDSAAFSKVMGAQLVTPTPVPVPSAS